MVSSNICEKTIWTYTKEIGVYGSVQQLIGLSSLIMLPIITKKLGVEQYGVMSLANTTSNFLIWFVLWSFPSGLIRFLSGQDDVFKVAQTFYTSLLVIILSGLAWFTIEWSIYPYLAKTIFGDLRYSIILHLVVLGSVFTSGADLFMTSFRIREENILYIRINTFLNILRIGLMIGILIISNDIVDFFIVIFFFNAIQFLWLFLRFYQDYGWASPNLKAFTPYFKFCLPLIIPQVMSWFISLSDRYFLGFFYDTTTVGIYSANYSLPNFILIFVSAVFFVFDPVFNRLWNNEDYNLLRDRYEQTAKLVIGLGLPMVTGLTVLSKPLMTLLSTPKIGDASMEVIPFVAISHLCYAFYSYGANIFLFQRRSLITGIFVTSGAVVNVLGNLVLIPRYNILGAAIATLLAYLVMTIFALTAARKQFSFSFDLIFLLKALIASVVMGVTLWFFPADASLKTLLLIPLGIVIYLGILFIIGGVPDQIQEKVIAWLKT